MPKEWTVSLGEANELLAERFGISRERRTSSRSARTRWPHAAWECRVLRRPRGRGPRRRPGPRRGHPRRLDGREARRAEAVVPHATATDHRGQRLAAQRRRVRAAARFGVRRLDLGLDPLARVAGRGAHALAPQDFGFAPVEAAEQALARAGIGWADVARSSSTRPSPRSPSPASMPGRSTRRSSTPRAARSPSATRWAPPAAASSAPSPTGSASPASAGASRRSASASARHWPSSSRTSCT